MRVTFVRGESLSQDIRTFYFMPPNKVEFTPGQFTELYLPHKDPDSRGQKRWFTLSSSPQEEHLAITTRHAPHGGSTFKESLWRLTPGSAVDLAVPMGDFVLPRDPTIPLVFVAAGIGITPFRSILSWLEYTRENRNIVLLWAISEPKDAVFASLFRKYGLKPQMYIKSAGQKLEVGEILAHIQGTDSPRIYLSGPEPMVESLTTSLEEAGVAKNALVSDYFPGYEPI